MSAVYPGLSWLAAAVPAHARRFRVQSVPFARTLELAGAELVETGPEVEIAPAGGIRGDAEVGVVSLGGPLPESQSRRGRAARRAEHSFQLRRHVAAARRVLELRGYSQTEVFRWSLARELRLPKQTGSRFGALADRVPTYAAAVGYRDGPVRTVLDAVLSDVAGQVSDSLLGPPSVREGPLVIVGGDVVVRVAVGGAASLLERQRSVLARLREARDHRLDPALLPWPIASGSSGIAHWSCEQRLPGAVPPAALTPSLLADCLDFLVSLHNSGAPGGEPSSTIGDAETLADTCGRAQGEAALALARRVETELAPLPRGFAHGDFFRGNLLVRADRLVGVVDWDAAGPGRLPLLDLIHLRCLAQHVSADIDWGPAIVGHLLPWARCNGDEIAQAYARRTGIALTARMLETLVIAYWLERVGYQLRNFASRIERPVWLERNVRFVLNAFAG
jgi:aminoglycoside phosphotransferase (APT) family kinase protein